jgi:UDP-glucose 4-epimerase
MKAIVTGGAGFVGSHTCDLLIKEGVSVTVFDDLSTGKEEYINKKSDFINIDVTDSTKVFDAASKIKPDCIFHLAAWARLKRSIDDPIGTNRVNVGGTLAMLETARRCKVPRFIYSSSSSIYGGQKNFKMKENFTPHPISHYALQKLIGEEYCALYAKNFGIRTLSLRYFNVFGERQPDQGEYSLAIGKFLRQIREGKKLTVFGDGEQTRDFTHVSDVANANLLSLLVDLPSGKNTTLNIGSSRETSVNQIVNLLGGTSEYIIPNPRGIYEERRKVADITLAKKVLNWEPKVTIEEGIKSLLKGK